MSFFEGISVLPKDPIFGLYHAYLEDPRPDKVDLTVGSYKDAQGKTAPFRCVHLAERAIFEKNLGKEYLPVEGYKEFLKATLEFLFGPKSTDSFFAAQAVGGTGALHIGGEFLSRHVTKRLFLPEPTWPNHAHIFKLAGLEVQSYPYFNLQKQAIDFDKFLASVKKMPPKSAILLHGCCHNPTGCDLSLDQWKELVPVLQKNHLLPFIDVAYLGFANGIDADKAPLDLFRRAGLEMLIALSFSKTLGLYGERVGMLALHLPEGPKEAVASQVKGLIRGIYSNPPLHGARVVAEVLQNFTLQIGWKQELETMRERLEAMRHSFDLEARHQGSSRDFSFLTRQKGLFSLCGLEEREIDRLREEQGIYIVRNGRINIAGLNAHNLKQIVKAFISLKE